MSKEHQLLDSFPMTGLGVSDEGLADELMSCMGGVRVWGNSLESEVPQVELSDETITLANSFIGRGPRSRVT